MHIKKSIHNFRMTIRDDLDQVWLRKVIDQMADLTPVPYAPNRFRGFVDPPSDYGYNSVFVKTYSHTDCQHTSFKRRHFFHRFRPRYANSEGNAYLNFQKNSLLTPALIGFGEEWHFGLRNRGIILIEAVNAPTVQEMLKTADYEFWINAAFKTITKIHKAKITHGDANLINFLALDKKVLSIDIENSRQITWKKQISDLINIIKSCFLEHDDAEIIYGNLINYRNSGLSLPVTLKELIEKGKKKAEKYKKNNFSHRGGNA